MKDLFITFFIFFRRCKTKEKWLFYLGAITSILAGVSEAYLFKYIDNTFKELSLSDLALISMLAILFLRFLWVYVNSFIISKGSSKVTQSIMEHFISKNFLNDDANTDNKIPQIINESERIGMGYYLAWQNILSNFMQFTALILAAAILASREFGLVITIIIPIYFAFLSLTSIMVSRFGFIRMDGLRKLSSRLSKNLVLEKDEINNTVQEIISSIFKVRIWSLIQKPTLEFMGIFSLCLSITFDVYYSQSLLSAVLPKYALLATIFIRVLPYINQVQNGFTLAASVNAEVKSFNES